MITTITMDGFVKRTLALAAALTASGCAVAADDAPGEIAGESRNAEVDATYYRLRLKHSNKCLQPASDATGAPLVQRPCSAGAVSAQDPQAFESVLPNPANPAQFMIRNARSAAAGNPLCMYVAGPGLDNGPEAIAYTCNTAQLQQQFLADAADAQGFGGIRAAHSNRYLTIIGAQTGDDAAVYQYGTSAAYDHQKIRREAGGDPIFDWPLGAAQASDFVPGWDSTVAQYYAHRGDSTWYGGRAHSGVDLRRNGDSNGAPVYAAADGVIRCAQWANYPGWVMVVEHTMGDGQKRYTQYGHLNQPTLTAGTPVTRGQQIATLFDQGSNSHLHFEVRDFLYWQGNTGNCAGPGYADTGYEPGDQGYRNPVDWVYEHRPAFSGLAVTDIPQNVRDLPDATNGLILTTLTPNTRYTVDQVTRDRSPAGSKNWWYRVQLGNGAFGWAAGYVQYDWPGELMLVEPPRGGSPPPAGPVIIDDVGSGFTRYGTPSYWQQASSGYQGHMWWTYANGNTRDDYARWTPVLPGAGSYEVQAFIPGVNATTTSAKYRITHAGATDIVARDQSGVYDTWISLGTYTFNGAGGEYVELGDDTGEAPSLLRQVGFDAVQFIKR